MTKKMDIRGLYSTEGNCYLQFSEQFSAAFEMTNSIDTLFITIFVPQTVSMNGSPLKTTNVASPVELYGSQPQPEENVGSSDFNTGNTSSKDTQFQQPPNQLYPPQWYSYPPSQPQVPGAPQFCHPAPLNLTPISQLICGVTEEYTSSGSSWQGYDFPPGGYSGAPMFPIQQFPGQAPSSPDASGVPPAPPGTIPVIQLTYSA
jgi:hypothetical protein